MLKIFLQSFTIFPVIGDAIFGNRPIIMGFLHLVFLGFVTLFILAYFIKKDLLNSKTKWTRIAVIAFAVAVILNEVFLISQGFAAMLINGSNDISMAALDNRRLAVYWFNSDSDSAWSEQ